MEKIVIASGWKYTDIDILACVTAYKELLVKEGKEVVVLLPGILNKSITDEIKKWDVEYTTDIKPDTSNKFIVVDLSEPEYITPLVDQTRIIELYDHHFGHENYWKIKLGKSAKIEKVGSCATLIGEENKKRDLAKEVSKTSAKLIIAAIISNTLNFKASVTDRRDIKAYDELKNIAKLPDDWTEKYFEDQEKSVFKNPQKEIINDTHTEKFPGTDETLIIGQIELWDSRKFINNYKSQDYSSYESNNNPLQNPNVALFSDISLTAVMIDFTL